MPAFLSLFALATAVPSWGWPANTLDEGILLVYPLRMMHGATPYRDFFAAYGPAHWWLLQGWYEVMSPTVVAERAFGLLVHVAVVVGLYSALGRRGRGQAAVAGLVASVLLFRLGDAPYAWVLGVAACVWQVSLLQASTRRALLGAGFLAGLTISIRPDMAPLAVLPAVPMLRRLSGRPAAMWAYGVGAGLVPLVVAFARAPGQLINDIVLGRAGRGAAQSRLPIPPAVSGDRVFLLVLAIAVLLLLVAALVGARTPLNASLALLAVSAVPQALQRADEVHFVYAALVSLPALPTACTHLLQVLGAVKRPRVLGTLVGIALIELGMSTAVIQPLLITLVGDGPEARPVRHDGRYLPELPARAAALTRLLPYLDAHTRPGDTIFVFDDDLVRPMITDVGVYYLTPRLRQRAHNLEITPGVTSHVGSGLEEDVRAANVVVLITASPTFRRALFPYERDGSAAARNLLRSQFCETARIDYYRVYLRC